MKRELLLVLLPALCGVCSPALAENPFSTSQARQRMILKTGRPENLMDNPARMVKIKYGFCDHFVDLQRQNSEPKDPVYVKKNQNESLAYYGQVMAPLVDFAAVNVGYGYSHLLLGNQSISTLDEAVFRDEDRTFSRSVNAGLSVQASGDLALGYGWSQQNQTDSINLATDDTGLNSTRRTTHTIGLNYSAWDVFLAYAAEDYSGEYNGRREADFANTQLQANLRYILGDVGRENLCTTASYTYGDLKQERFEFGRETYALDFLNHQLDLKSYYAMPAGLLEYAVGLEGMYADKNIFAYDPYAWVNYQHYRAGVPCWISVRAWPFLRLWAEVEISYSENTYTRTRELSLQESFGLQAQYAFLEAVLYIMPTGLWTSSDTEDQQSGTQAGLEVKAKF